MEQILLAHSHPKENVTAIMILYKYTKGMVRLHIGGTDRNWSLAKGYICIIFVYNMPRQRTSNVDRSNERK